MFHPILIPVLNGCDIVLWQIEQILSGNPSTREARLAMLLYEMAKKLSRISGCFLAKAIILASGYSQFGTTLRCPTASTEFLQDCTQPRVPKQIELVSAAGLHASPTYFR
jgi:hypothetical protein